MSKSGVKGRDQDVSWMPRVRRDEEGYECAPDLSNDKGYARSVQVVHKCRIADVIFVSNSVYPLNDVENRKDGAVGIVPSRRRRPDVSELEASSFGTASVPGSRVQSRIPM